MFGFLSEKFPQVLSGAAVKKFAQTFNFHMEAEGGNSRWVGGPIVRAVGS